MPFLAFLGCDGSGKSAVIRNVSERLKAEGHQVTLGHWRPKPFGKSSSTSQIADAPHKQSPRGTVTSMVKLVWLWLNWWIAWFQHLRAESRQGYVIFDRFHADLIVDPKRYRYGGPLWLAKLASRMMPRPNRVFFLDASPEVLISRKQEVSYQALQDSRDSYLNLKTAIPDFTVVDASEPLESVIGFVLDSIGSPNKPGGNYHSGS
jgi:thymidylate kinase